MGNYRVSYMCRKKEVNKLVVIGHGILEFRKGNYYGKKSVIEYLHRISKYFDKTYFVCRIMYNMGNLKTVLNLDKVELIKVSWGSVENILTQFISLLKDQLKLIKLVTKRTAVIINSPRILFTPILLFLRIKSGYLLGYMGNNPKGVARLYYLKGGMSNIIKGKITILFGKLTSIFSDSLVVRGDISQYQRYGNKVHESKPIIVLSKRPSFKRGETCNKENITIIYVGGLYKNKGVDILINAFSSLIEKDISNKPLYLKIIGDGEEYNNLFLKSKRLNLNNKIEFLGYIDNPERLAREYLSSDIFVLPTRITEGMPRVVDEAMYYGLPVILSDIGYSGSLEHKKNVFFIKPGSFIDLEKAIEEIIKNDGLRRKMIENGKKRIENIIGGDPAADQHAKIIKGNK